MRIKLVIDEYIIKRASYVPKSHVCTDCAFALVLKQAFPGVHVFDQNACFTDDNGYDHAIPLPPIAQDWIKQYDRTPPAERVNLPNLSVKLDLPQDVVDAIGDFKLTRILRHSRYLSLTT